MPHDELRRVTPAEVQLLLAITNGATYPEVAAQTGRKPAAVARAFERLREKLGPYGGGTKAGMVHWIDTHYDEWSAAMSIPMRR